MTNVVSHRGYSATIAFDADDGVFFGRVAGIADGVGFHADTVDGLLHAFREAVDDYLETCAAVGRKPDKPYSGKLMLRVDPAVHAQAALAAELAGQSLNQFGEEALRSVAERTLRGQDRAAA